MTPNRQHIIFRIFTLYIVAMLTLPALTKCIHIFEHHNHIVCENEDTTHIHQVDLDCDFQKFQIFTNFTPLNLSFCLKGPKEKHGPIVSSGYDFLSKFQSLHFSLRGPPYFT
ncbi:hypothetical protein C1A40_00580 [Tamlana carrageenivorans]|uniref:Uncharacterized protein n=1 Tax=Pseudotamlana carrageenivorans TaxID=2069432 RepID=A0A2I7SDV0_9FLAO|nr:hypothetical protein C1A40_00580 [Tamlana carrageenivorans]